MSAQNTSSSAKSGFIASRRGVRGEYSDRIDALFASMDCQEHAGVNLAVLKGGTVVHQRGYGVANIENDVPFSSATVLHLGSTSKHFCATAILILEDRGLLSLADSIRKYVSELPPFMEHITLRHLLTMTSGLPDGLNYSFFAGLPEGAMFTRAAHLDILTRMTVPMFEAGAGMTYSNSNYLLLSLVVERVGAVPLAEFLRRELFAPLGMDSTQLQPDMTSAVPNKATGYVPGGDGVPRRASFSVELSGDGGIQSSLDDMVKWFLNYRSGNKLVSRHRERLEAVTILTDGSSIPYRLGITVSEFDGRRKISHGGGMPGYLCDFAYFPDNDLGVIMLANWMDVTIFEKSDAIANIISPREKEPSATVDLPSGFYIDFERGYAAELAQEDGQTWLHIMGEKLALRKTGPRTYASAKAPVFCTLRAGERKISDRPILDIQWGTVESLRFEPVGDSKAVIDNAQEFAGRYENVLLGETHHVSVENGVLYVSLKNALRKLLWDELKPRGRDIFSAIIPGEPSDTDMTLIFRRDAAGRVVGFDYNTSRTRGVNFARRD